MYHSFLSLTGERELLRHECEGSPQRFLIRAGKLGYLVWPLFSNRFEPATEKFWWSLKGACKGETDVRLLLTLKRDDHVVGLQADFKNGKMVICDPGKGDLQSFDFPAFLKHPDYPEVLEVLCVDSGKIEDYDPITRH